MARVCDDLLPVPVRLQDAPPDVWQQLEAVLEKSLPVQRARVQAQAQRLSEVETALLAKEKRVGELEAALHAEQQRVRELEAQAAGGGRSGTS
jgi:hypothetical protein